MRIDRPEIIGGSLTFQETGGTDLLTITVDPMASTGTYHIPDVGTSADFLLSANRSPSPGSILYHDGTSWAQLAAGASGYLLETRNTGTAPIWISDERFIVNDPATSTRNVITAGSDVIPLTVKGFSSQTANLVELKNTSGDVAIAMTDAGALKVKEAGVGTDLATISVAALAASRAYSIPDAGGDARFVMSTTASPAQGDVLYYNGTTWSKLSAGINGYFLATRGSGANPIWAPPVFMWIEVTSTSQTASVNTGYICNNVGLVTVGLPAVAPQGSIIRISGKGSGGWKVSQETGQQIRFGSVSTTLGAGGYLSSTNQYDCVELLVITANTEFQVVSSQGNITYV